MLQTLPLLLHGGSKLLPGLLNPAIGRDRLDQLGTGRLRFFQAEIKRLKQIVHWMMESPLHVHFMTPS